MIDPSVFDGIKFTPHQMKAILGTINRPQVLNVMGTGRGKTYVVAGHIKVLAAKGLAEVALVLTSPRGVLAYAKLKGSQALAPFCIAYSVADLAELMMERLSGDRSDSIIVVSVKSLALWMGRLLSSIGASGGEDWETSVRRSVSLDTTSGIKGLVTGRGRQRETERSSKARYPAVTSSQELESAITMKEMKTKSESASGEFSLPNNLDREIGYREEVRRGDEIDSLAYSPLRGIPPIPEPSPASDPAKKEKTPSLSSYSSRRVSALGAFLLGLFDPDTVYIDEVHDYRNAESEAYLALSALLSAYRGRRQGLTATPIYAELENVYAIYSLVVPSLFPSYNHFSNAYLIRTPKEVWTSRYVKTPHGTKKIPFQQVTYPITGVKNQDHLKQVIDPYLYLDVETGFTTNLVPVEYALEGFDIDHYSEAARGVGLGELWRVKYLVAGDSQPKQVLLRDKETLWVARSYQDSFAETLPCNLTLKSILRLPQGLYGEIVGVDRKITKADLTQRMVPMMKALSASESKLSKLKEVIGQYPGQGMLIFCSYKESLVVVRDALVSWGLNVVSITGGEGNMKKKLASITKSTYTVITPVAIQSLDFYLQHLVIYEPVTLPGPLVQLMGRITRENADFREVWVHIPFFRRGVDFYFLLRLEKLLRDEDPLMKRSIGFSEYLNQVPGEGAEEIEYLKQFILWGMSGKKEVH